MPTSRASPATRPVSAELGVPAEPLVDQVYRSIREAIREGRLSSGHRLVEREVAAWLEVSRTPVREALKLLEAQGLLSADAGRALVVRALSLEEVVELYSIWEDLEGIAARDAARHATALELATLRQIGVLWDENADPKLLGRLNNQFHQVMHRAAHNRFLLRALETVDDSVALLGVSTYSVARRRREVGYEHRAVIDAVARRDATTAEESARQHIRNAGQLRMMLMSGTPPEEA
jgi:DNA-binding GntR family transcriptional regulator